MNVEKVLETKILRFAELVAKYATVQKESEELSREVAYLDTAISGLHEEIQILKNILEEEQ